MLQFASTIALSSFLLFLVQPIIAKQVLPWFGGTSAVWTVCLVFFQVVLLAGYSYAHLITTRLTPKNQSRLHIALLLLSLLLLPIIPSVAFKPAADTDAALRILLLLGATVGLPYFLLSTTGPLIQKWFADQYPQKTVYRLFALSNFGSLIGLLAFPFAIEPFSSSTTQSYAWSAAYAVFVALAAWSAWRAGRAPARIDQQATQASAPPPDASSYGLWLAFSALGSVLLLATTSHITQNIASVPFLWVIPLSLYLFSFVLAFEGRGGKGWYEQKWLLLPTLVLLVGMSAGMSAHHGILDINLAVPLFMIGMFMAALFCNGELARHKPAPRYLTHFYLTISLGGAIGGLFVGLVAPRIFSTYFEMPLALFALAALAILVTLRNRWLIIPAIAATMLTCYYGVQYVEFIRDDVMYAHRNFYGTLRIREQGSGEQQVRRLLHGVILHGEQYTSGPHHLEPGTYYAPTSGVGRAIQSKEAAGAVKVGVVGLGTGTLSAYGRAGDTFRFYELDPDVLAMSKTRFTYLNSSLATLQFVIGDARLSMEREIANKDPQKYDVLAIDAFSSDSIPVHLLTREAIDLYIREMADDGIIAVHISNRFLDLKPVLANIAAATGLTAVLINDIPGEDSIGSTTDWVLMARNPAVFQKEQFATAEPLQPDPTRSLWTDKFNNLLEVLKTRPWDKLKDFVLQR